MEVTEVQATKTIQSDEEYYHLDLFTGDGLQNQVHTLLELCFLLRLIFLDFSKFQGALGTHFGSPNVFKMGSKIKRIKCMFFGSPLERLGGANGALWQGATLINPPAGVRARPVGRGKGSVE